MKIQATADGFAVAALAAALVGGIYFGLFSCGGLVWEKTLFACLTAAVTLMAIGAPAPTISRWTRRIAFPFTVFALFWLCQAIAAPFYPAEPSSLSMFVSLFLGALEHGPC